MIRSGKFISEFIDTDEESVQPNGVDLSVDKIYEAVGHAVLSDEDYIKPHRKELEPVNVDEKEVSEIIERKSYVLEPGYYIIEYSETIEIPEEHVGLVFPRSRLMRSGSSLYTAVWDSGYKGKGEGGLRVDNKCYIEEGMDVGQIIYLTTEDLEDHYDGKHQGENID